MSNDSYNIYLEGRRIHTHLTTEEYFNIMEDLSMEFYQTGFPRPEDLKTEIIKED